MIEMDEIFDGSSAGFGGLREIILRTPLDVGHVGQSFRTTVQ